MTIPYPEGLAEFVFPWNTQEEFDAAVAAHRERYKDVHPYYRFPMVIGMAAAQRVRDLGIVMPDDGEAFVIQPPGCG